MTYVYVWECSILVLPYDTTKFSNIFVRFSHGRDQEVPSSIHGSLHLHSSQVQASKRINFKVRSPIHFCQSISDDLSKTLGSLHRAFQNERAEKIFYPNSDKNGSKTSNLFERNVQCHAVKRTKHNFDSQLRLSQNLKNCAESSCFSGLWSKICISPLHWGLEYWTFL